MSKRPDGNPLLCSSDECTAETACAECQAEFDKSRPTEKGTEAELDSLIKRIAATGPTKEALTLSKSAFMRWRDRCVAEATSDLEFLAKRLYVAETEQRAIDTAFYGATSYGPRSLEDCRIELGLAPTEPTHE